MKKHEFHNLVANIWLAASVITSSWQAWACLFQGILWLLTGYLIYRAEIKLENLR